MSRSNELRESNASEYPLHSPQGLSATVTADRCAGTVSYANVRDGPDGAVLKTFECPTAEEAAAVKLKVAEDPEVRASEEQRDVEVRHGIFMFRYSSGACL